MLRAASYSCFLGASVSSTGVAVASRMNAAAAMRLAAASVHQTGAHELYRSSKALTRSGASIAASDERQFPTALTRPTWAFVTSR